MAQIKNSRKSEGLCEKTSQCIEPFQIKKPSNFSSAGKENRVNRVQEFEDKEILIIRGQKFSKRKHEAAAAAARFEKAKSYKDDELIHEGRFSEYISKVKNRMMKTASNVERNISFK